MKRGLILALFLFGIFLCSSFALAGSSDVVYIYKNERRIDMNVISVLSDMNLDVHLMNSKEIKTADFSEYEAIYIGDERLQNIEYLPDLPLIVLNKYYGRQLGLVTRGGISQTAANRPLKVLESEESVQVYDRSLFKRKRINIPYYYIRDKYLAEGMEAVAKPDVGYKKDKGSVIVYSTQGTNKCFFGVTKSDYWTAEAEQMFRDCVGFVLGEPLVPDPEPEPEPEPDPMPDPDPVPDPFPIGGVHDVGLVENYDGFGHEIRLKNSSNDIIEEETPVISCGLEYDIQFRTENKGDFNEDVLINLSILDYEGFVVFNNLKTRTDLEPGDGTTTGNQNNFIFDFINGVYNIEVSVMISEDANPADNSRSRAVEIIGC